MTMTSGELALSLANYEERATDFGNPNWVAYQTIVRTEVRPVYSHLGADNDSARDHDDPVFHNFRESHRQSGR